jgi:hypothetical protein
MCLKRKSWKYCCVLGGEAGSIAAYYEDKLEVLMRLRRKSWKEVYCCTLGGEAGSIAA